jgi:hypothetical protein
MGILVQLHRQAGGGAHRGAFLERAAGLLQHHVKMRHRRPTRVASSRVAPQFQSP